MEDPPPFAAAAAAEDAAAAAWDWDNLLNFSLNSEEIETEEPLILPWAAESDALLHPQSGDHPAPPLPTVEEVGRVRKRDPRLICPNYLAGRVPCACPELDAKAAEEEEVAEIVAGARKRVRKSAPGGAQIEIRCQVPGCEADIKELKGYHRRHRVCLRCANASCVVLEGEQKRYCQQCGKFHVLPDFDEGKRSCRRKLERHNKRRRRRPDSKTDPEKETEDQVDFLVDLTCDGQPVGETSNGVFSEPSAVSSKTLEKETSTGSDEAAAASPNCTLPDAPNEQNNNSVISFIASTDVSEEQKLENSKPLHTSLGYDNRSVYSSSCPTGRISFKLYDWNPAEFPRRLRHQIFEWLASMPVELEGYIRPGCTILTVFIAMPQSMWDKLSRDAASLVKELVNAPDSLLVGRGTFYIQLDNTIFQILKDGTSLMNIKMEVHAPRIHYVHPTYFEVGKPIEFIVCGSYLNQPKFRSLVSFNGKYVKHKCRRVKFKSVDDYSSSSDHEMLKMSILQTDTQVHGPAFIEVENASGLSNFVPVLFGNKHICAELAEIQEKALNTCPYNSFSCKYFISKQNVISQLMLDIAWLQRRPNSDEYYKNNVHTAADIKRLTCLLSFLVANNLNNLIGIVLSSLENLFRSEMLSNLEKYENDPDVVRLLDILEHAKVCLGEISVHGVKPDLGSSKNHAYSSNDDFRSSYVCSDQESDVSKAEDEQCSSSSSSTTWTEDEEERIALLQSEKTTYRKYCNSKARARYAPILMVCIVVVCVTACIVLFHPHNGSSSSGSFVVSVRRCMYWDPAS